jgi:signal transduction histidine kinase
MNTSLESEKKPDIIIVDDIPDNIRFLSSFLVEQGYNVRKAINGQMALKAIAALTPDLILLDVNMPDLNGYEVCRSLKENALTNAVPVIFLSAGNDVIDKVKAFQVGGVDYITKPFNLEEVLIRIQTQLTIQNLQNKLAERNIQLEQALDRLKDTQVGIVQREKMATLSKVVAGVAHEVNNPLSFILGNIAPAQEYVNHLLTVFKLYQQECPEVPPSVTNYLKEVDLDFLTSDLNSLINSIKNGAERIRTVILALRIFARLDESGIKQIDIHECIDSTLLLLKYRLESNANQPGIKIVKNYGKLPLVTGHADQMNQVFFNLLVNAIDAIKVRVAKQDSSFEPYIAITTQLVDQNTVSIRIKDNGIGVAAENQSQLFEPFYTTKPAGKGIGLGLTASQKIIEEMHGGSLMLCSVPDEGAEVLIKIPAICKSEAEG